MILRLADPDDPVELAAVGALTVAAYTADGYLRGAEDGYAEHLLAAGDRARDAELVVAVDEVSGALVGTVTYCVAGSPWAEVSQPGEAEFRMLAVAPEARGRGVGAALTAWCLDRARAEGRSAMVLSTLTVMHTAHRLYERAGFVRTPERDWWPVPDIQLITYRLALDPVTWPSEAGEEAGPVDHDAGDLSMPEHGTVAVLGQHLEPQQPSVDVHQVGPYDDGGADPAGPQVRELDPGPDRRARVVEAAGQSLQGRVLAPGEQPWGGEHVEVAAAEGAGGVVGADAVLDESPGARLHRHLASLRRVVDEGPWCGQCGDASTGDHGACADRRELEPPRYCGRCRRRMVVQVLPRGWSARCVEHGVRTG